jgi:hypothetical protein
VGTWASATASAALTSRRTSPISDMALCNREYGQSARIASVTRRPVTTGSCESG